MARQLKLKVFRAPIGFHDVYVAAPSRKAALEAWGSDHDLFARGIAEEVKDPQLIREPLAKPGEIIRRSRGTAAEQIAALPKAPVKSSARAEPAVTVRFAKKTSVRQKAVKTPKLRADRAALRNAEEAFVEAERQHASERSALAHREAELQRERRKLQKRQDQQLAKLTRDLEKARDSYSRAIERGND